jgi:hypothetical protein
MGPTGNLSFDDVDEDFILQERNTDATSTLSNPNLFWSSNGIAYDVSANSGAKDST